VLDPKPVRLRKRDRAGKKQALLQAALRLFSSRGYEATTTREIAASAGCAEGLIHRYFNGKAGLLPALVEDLMSKDVEYIGFRLAQASTLEEEFLKLISWEIDLAWEKRDLFRVFIPRALVDPSVSSVMNQAVLLARSGLIAKRLRRYPQCMHLEPPELEALAQSVGMLGMVFGFMRPVLLGQDRAAAKEIGIAHAKMLIGGVARSRD
jgi:AcrR family transcriptional regulator